MVDITANSKTRTFQQRNLRLAVLVSGLHDDALVGPEEISAFTGLAKTSIQKIGQRQKLNMPEPLLFCRHLSWKFGSIRQWAASLGTGVAIEPKTCGQNKGGRPTKAQQLSKKNGAEA